MNIDINAIDPPPGNVRRIAASIDDDAALQASIASPGVPQPILVIRNGKRFTLVDGERRWKAARAAGPGEISAEMAPRLDLGWAAAASAALGLTEQAGKRLDGREHREMPA